MGSVSCNMSKTAIWVMGRGVSFRGGFPSRRRGVASSGSGTSWDLFWGIRVRIPMRHHARMMAIYSYCKRDEMHAGGAVIKALLLKGEISINIQTLTHWHPGIGHLSFGPSRSVTLLIETPLGLSSPS